ncbi:MAG: FAD/NAD(P)-binding protein, partial [Sphingobacterium sp.]
MIWKTTHISEEGLMGRDFIRKMIHQNSGSTKQNDVGSCVGIVGGGPKGLYALEELLHCLNEEKTPGLWRILWWNETEDFGCGPNYQVDQPDYLLINYCIGHVDAWDRTRHLDNFHMSFMDWILKFKIIDQEVRPTDFASRSLVGQYLQHVTMQVIASKNENVELTLIPEKVRDIRANFDDKLLIQSSDRDFYMDNLLLTTGHCYRNLPLIDFQEKSIPENYIAGAYPLHHLDKIPPKQKVGIIGWGLTFIDVALQLTEGRGGNFDQEGNYIPSGKEPIILPFSRNQLPIFPRGPIYGKNTYQLQYLNAKWLTDFYAIKRKRKIDFRAEIFPFLEKELSFA